MSKELEEGDLLQISPSGYHIALRVGFAFPLAEINAFPAGWIDHYTQQRFMLFDPIIRWVYSNTGAIRWSECPLEDPRKVLGQAATFGLRFGVAISCFDGNAEGQRSFGSFARSDREFTDPEIKALTAYVSYRHMEMAPPTNLTRAELEALGMVKQGMRLKQIAFEIGVTEGAVKQRLKNAKLKLHAQTSAQAATRAHEFGLI
ncbi:autoinducer binding domain-containing protein [Aestuariibius sp. HNIBRBA575]|uniref:helix-turn-helix transcriptional regulator n=1 Tax=Aestuariibius sp. HNIBRBA575 TaxID=3233343 RepID=UPI0034A32A52